MLDGPINPLNQYTFPGSGTIFLFTSLAHCAGSGTMLLLACCTAPDVVWYSSFPLALYRIWYDTKYRIYYAVNPFLSRCAGSGVIFLLTCHCAGSGTVYSFLLITLCGIWYNIHSYLLHCAGSGMVFLLTCHTVRDLGWYSFLPVTHWEIFYTILSYLSHCAGSGMIYPSSDSSHSTWEDWAFLQREVVVKWTWNSH